LAQYNKEDLEPKQDKDRAAFWNNKVTDARDFEETWRDRSQALVERYRDDSLDRQERPFHTQNIFYSNVDTLKSALYFKTPKPKVTRRFNDGDPLGRQIARVIERGLQYQLDMYNFDSTMRKAIEDMLIVGRGTVRMRYEPVIIESEPQRIEVEAQPIGENTFRFISKSGEEFETGQVKQDTQGLHVLGPPEEVVGEQSIYCEYVHWSDFVIEPNRNWDDVNWIAFRHLMTRQQLIDYYGDAKANKIPLTYSPDYQSNNKNRNVDRAEIYEIWDKSTSKQIFIAASHDEILEENDDPYNLMNFWPCPEPLYGITTTSTTIPVPEFFIYEDQVSELDLITARIGVLTEALKRRGVYDASFQELNRLSDAADNQFVPVDNMAMLNAGGGLTNVMQEAPLDNIIKALQQLYQSRQVIVQTIYEIVGVSDLMRGQTASRETATAQRIKGQFGSLRLVNRQREIERFIDQIMEMKGEMLVENLEPEVLQKITGLQVTPEMVAVIQDDRLRCFRVRIDTDESGAIDQAVDQKQRTEFLTATVQFMQALGPLVQSGSIGFEQGKQMLLFAARAFPGARELEESLEAIEAPQPAGPSPTDKLVEVEAAKVQAQTEQASADAQVKIARLQLDKQKADTDERLKQEKLEIEKAKLVAG
tara:strand:- start:5703 stop:7646 length:1944 start_codon:yes stop_codon:yes gene_type:complete